MWRDTPINLVAFHGHTEIVKFLARLTDNPNAPPCHTKIVEFLAPLTKNPNASEDDGKTPIP